MIKRRCVVCYHLHLHLSHGMPIASSMAQLHLFHHDNKSEMQHWDKCWHHMMPTAPKLLPLHFLAQDNWNEVQHDFLVIWCHWYQHWHDMMPYALVSCDATAVKSASCDVDSSINGINALLRSWWLKWEAISLFQSFDTWHWHQHHVMPMALSVVPLYALGHDKWNNVQLNFLFMYNHWYLSQCHMMPTVFSMVPFHLLGQDDQKEMQNDFLVM